MNLGIAILTLLTLILISFIVYRFWIEDVRLLLSASDSIYPRPIVRIYIAHEGEIALISDDVFLERFPSRNFELIVGLTNNSSEPSIRSAFAAGVLIVLNGARVDGYDLGEFSSIIGVSEDGSILNPINSSIVELFANKIDPWQSISAELHVVAENGSDCILIAYRGWIIDEDDVVVEPISGAKEHYIARFPAEECPDNPPDSRWAGKDFMKYKLHEAGICFS